MDPLVSVVIPVFNAEATLSEALRSALDQDYANLELLAIDDGSSDDSVQKLREFGDPVRVIQVPNGGPARARNLGLDQARGKYIAFLDADDVWLPGKLRAQIGLLESRPEVGGCYTGWHLWSAGADHCFVRPTTLADVPLDCPVDPERSGWIYDRLLLECEPLTTTMVLRAETVQRIGRFDPELLVGEDYDYWLRLSQLAQIVCLDWIGALYRVVPGSASRTVRLRNFEYDVLTRNIARFGLASPGGHPISSQRLQRRLDQLVFQHGHLHLQRGDADVALRSFIDLLRRRPVQPRLLVNLARAAWRRIGRHAEPATPR
jgi:glycosyltransferase involved in cell wall biosynthesis